MMHRSASGIEHSPSVTVVVPVFNRLRYLAATLDGVFRQSLSEWALIVVDDGSQEDVGGFIAAYADPRIRFVRQENQGNAVARNTGIGQSASEFVVCLDSDDVWQPEFLAACTEYLAGHAEVDVAYTQVQAIGAEGQPRPRPIGPPSRSGDLLADLLMGYPILPSSALIRRHCFDLWGAFTPGMDDWELWLRWAAHGCRFACIEQPLLRYRLHEQNLNLEYERRRTAHFAMLDRFYSQEPLPEAAHSLREAAYANQHYLFAVLAGQVGRSSDAAAEFAAAVLGQPEYLGDLDFYTRIACAHQGRIDAGTPRGLDLSLAEGAVLGCMDAMFSRPDLPQEIRARRGEAYGWAYLALARVAYGVALDMRQARRWLWQAVGAWPDLAWRSDWAAWVARSAVGYNRVQAAKRTLRQESHRE